MSTSPSPRVRPIEPIHAKRYHSVGDLLSDALVAYKTETALITMDRRREVARYTYRDFERMGHQVACRFQDDDLGPEDRIAILMTNGPKWLLSAFAGFVRGAVLVPLDYKLTAREHAELLAHAKPKALVVEYPLWRKLSQEAIEVPEVYVADAPEGAELGVGKRWEDLPEAGRRPVKEARSRQDIACIVYSSGTGGRPKGCMLTHGNYLAQYTSLTGLYPLLIGDRYFSILPTNHAIDFMVGFIGPMGGGAAVVHQRTLRPEFILATMKKCRITHMAIVPLVLTAFERALKERLAEQPEWKQRAVDALGVFNQSLTRRRPNTPLSRRLLAPIHEAFGGHLKLLICGGAFVDRARAEFFYRFGIPVVIGYGLTEAGTAVTVQDLRPFRADSVGPPLEGVELRIDRPDAKGIGEVMVRSETVFAGYLEDPDQTAEVLTEDGWLRTGDLGWVDGSHHLHLVGRSKNMIVTAGGKNIYPEDIEGVFEGSPCAELAVFAANYVWKDGAALDAEQLVIVVREDEDGDRDALHASLRRKNMSLPDFKRVHGVLHWEPEFPRTASMKVKRSVLADAVRAGAKAEAVVPL